VSAETEERNSAVSVFARRDFLIGQVLLGIPIGAILGYLFWGARGDGGALAFCVLFGVLWFVIAANVVRELAAPRPVMRLDEDGFESAVGRVRWSDLDRVGRFPADYGDEILFVLRPGTEIRPAMDGLNSSLSLGAKRSFRRDGIRVVRSDIFVQAWADWDECRRMIATFYAGEIAS
jgi:hypothetical protein